jgi:hypothetical protein
MHLTQSHYRGSLRRLSAVRPLRFSTFRFPLRANLQLSWMSPILVLGAWAIQKPPGKAGAHFLKLASKPGSSEGVDCGKQRADAREQRTENREQRTENREQRTEDRGQRTDVRCRKSERRKRRSDIGPDSERARRLAERRNQAAAAALARTLRFHSNRKTFISALRTNSRAATPLYFLTMPVTTLVTAPWFTSP